MRKHVAVYVGKVDSSLKILGLAGCCGDFFCGDDAPRQVSEPLTRMFCGAPEPSHAIAKVREGNVCVPTATNMLMYPLQRADNVGLVLIQCARVLTMLIGI